jgi:hypothetical protein
MPPTDNFNNSVAETWTLTKIDLTGSGRRRTIKNIKIMPCSWQTTLPALPSGNKLCLKRFYDVLKDAVSPLIRQGQMVHQKSKIV